MKINNYKGLVSVLRLFFVLLCVAVLDIRIEAEVFASDISGRDLSKSEVGYLDQEKIDQVLVEGGIRGDGGNKNLLADDLFRHQLSQNDKGEEPKDNESGKPAGAKEQIDVKVDGRGIVFDAMQYCQGKFKRLGGTGVEIITVRCPRVDDSCNCEGEKKSPTKWVECGDVRKDSTVGSDLLSCESKIVGSGAAASSE